MKKRLASALSIPIYTETETKLILMARKLRVTKTDLARQLLVEGLEELEATYEEPKRQIYLIRLNEAEVTRLKKLGHEIESDGVPLDLINTSYEEALSKLTAPERKRMLYGDWIPA